MARYDLEQRTFEFARAVAQYARELPRNVSSIEYGKQVVRSSGSVGANYIEANEALSKKDFLMRIKICRKEAKESVYWLRLIDISDGCDQALSKLIQEGAELTKIFGSIVEKSE